jgi:hypothetical protein
LTLTVETVLTNQSRLLGWGLIPDVRGVGMGKNVVIFGKAELTALL